MARMRVIALASNDHRYGGISQDNPTTWFDWSGPTRHNDTLAFTRGLIAMRQQHPALHRARYFDGRVNSRGIKDLTWHGSKVGSPGWHDPSGQLLGFTFGAVDEVDSYVHVVANMSDQAIDVELPDPAGRRWYRAVDTAQPPGADLSAPGSEPAVDGGSYRVGPRSILVLVSHDGS